MSKQLKDQFPMCGEANRFATARGRNSDVCFYVPSFGYPFPFSYLPLFTHAIHRSCFVRKGSRIMAAIIGGRTWRGSRQLAEWAFFIHRRKNLLHWIESSGTRGSPAAHQARMTKLPLIVLIAIRWCTTSGRECRRDRRRSRRFR